MPAQDLDGISLPLHDMLLSWHLLWAAWCIFMLLATLFCGTPADPGLVK